MLHAILLNAGEDLALPENLLVPLGSTSNRAMQEANNRMKEALDDVRLNLVKAQERTKTQVDKTRRVEECKVGDQVFLSTQHLQTFAVYLLPNLRRRWVDPLTIIKVISQVTFRLDLPLGQ